MVRVSTFCPRCGETIDADVTDEAKAAGRASLECPSCRLEFIIAPTRRPTAPHGDGPWQRSDAPNAIPGPPAAPSAVAGPGASRRRTSFRPVAAGMLLFFAALLGAWMGSVLAFQDDLMTSGFAAMQGEGNFTGRVTGPDGDPLDGVLVAVVVEENGTLVVERDTTTGSDGLFAFPGIDPGVHRFRYSKENHTTVLLDAPAYPQDYARLLGDASVLGSITMRPGDPDEVRTVSRVDEFTAFARGWGWFTLAASALAAAGGVVAVRRRRLWLAVAGAVAGIFTFGFVVGSAAALLALGLILWSRKEFQRPPAAAPS